MFGRPIPIWIILAFLTYSVVGALSDMARAVGGGQAYAWASTLFGLLFSAVSVWLAAEIWTKGELQVIIAWALVGVVALMYLVSLAAYFKPETGTELSVRSQYVMVAAYSLAMVGIYALIPWYLMRRRSA